jgi:hypothetical protein
MTGQATVCYEPLAHGFLNLVFFNAFFSRHSLIHNRLFMPDDLMTFEAARIFDGDMLLVHQLLVADFFKGFGLVVAGEAISFFDVAGTYHKGGFEYAFFEVGLILGPAGGLDDIIVTAAAGNFGIFHDLMGDGFFA